VLGKKSIDWRLAFAPAVGIGAFVLYVATAYPDLTGGDGGELAAAVATGGVMHPPGYPLYAILGRVAAWLPLAASVAGRLNLLSAVCDAFAAAFLCAAMGRRTGSRAAGLTAAVAFALAPVVWSYAICAEVFALNNLLGAVLVWLAVRYDEHAERRFAMWGAFVVGLGLANHHTFVFAAAPIAGGALWRGRADLLEPRTLTRLAGAVGAGLLPYAYLPLAASGGSPIRGGRPTRGRGSGRTCCGASTGPCGWRRSASRGVPLRWRRWWRGARAPSTTSVRSA
jgi:hypothetical protein